MTYRDFIFILCFVALGAWCWAGPITTPEPQETPLAESVPSQVKKQPKLTPSEKKADESWVQPKLAVKVAGRASSFDDLVLSGTLLPRTNSLNLEMGTANKPRVQVVVTAEEEQWVFNSPLASKDPRGRTVSGTKTITWEVALSSLEPDRDITGLKALFGKKPLAISMEVFEVGKQHNPMSRRLVISISGATSVPVSQ